MSESTIDLVYIASIGRSGTTLFETMLGAHSQIETSGELHLWPHEILQGGMRPCGSGLYVDECPFWTEMRSRIDPLKQPEPRIHHFREEHDAGQTLRAGRLRDFINRPVSSTVAQKIDTYGQNNAEIFSTFQKLIEERTGSGPAWIVDASKDPYRLLWLIRSGYFNVKVFHMVKNPRSFAYSVTDNWIEKDGVLSDLKRLYYTARQAGAWVVRNRLFRLIVQNHVEEGDHMLIRYEDLATRPHDIFRQACRLIGIDYEEESVENWRSGSRFTIAGNPMRYEDRDIELDERWKRNLPYSSRLVARSISSVNRSRYGY
jgi:hypothetical protein